MKRSTEDKIRKVARWIIGALTSIILVVVTINNIPYSLMIIASFVGILALVLFVGWIIDDRNYFSSED